MYSVNIKQALLDEIAAEYGTPDQDENEVTAVEFAEAATLSETEARRILDELIAEGKWTKRKVKPTGGGSKCHAYRKVVTDGN
jgi:predicted transcriptional regulator